MEYGRPSLAEKIDIDGINQLKELIPFLLKKKLNLYPDGTKRIAVFPSFDGGVSVEFQEIIGKRIITAGFETACWDETEDIYCHELRLQCVRCNNTSNSKFFSKMSGTDF